MPNSNISSETQSVDGNTLHDKSTYTGSFFRGNYVYGAAMNLAWNDLATNVIHETIQLKTDNSKAQETLLKLNTSPFIPNDLDEKSYYIKSGYGQQTVDHINKESREKFPQKTFSDLHIQIDDHDIITYAYFLKEVEYETPFSERYVSFKAFDSAPSEEPIKVSGFQAKEEEQKANVVVVKYWSDEKFIVSLVLKDSADQLFLAKGFDMMAPDNVVAEIKSYSLRQQTALDKAIPETLAEGDYFEMPDLDLDYHRDYEEMMGTMLANKNFEDYKISQMFENIKFKMDYKGARVENEAVIEMQATALPPAEFIKVRKFILDKPFWVIMKRTTSHNPYFILGVNNTELMKKV